VLASILGKRTALLEKWSLKGNQREGVELGLLKKTTEKEDAQEKRAPLTMLLPPYLRGSARAATLSEERKGLE